MLHFIPISVKKNKKQLAQMVNEVDAKLAD